MFSWHVVCLSFLLLPSVFSAPQDWHSNSHCTSTQTKTLTITSSRIVKTTHVTSISTSTAPAKTTTFSVTTNSTTTNVQTSTNVTTTTTTLTTVSTSTVQPPPSYTPVDVSIPGAQSGSNGTITKRGSANVVEERETRERAHYNQASGPDQSRPFTSLGNSGQAQGSANTTWSQWQGKPSCLTTTTTITKTVPAAPITKTLTSTLVTVTTPVVSSTITVSNAITVTSTSVSTSTVTSTSTVYNSTTTTYLACAATNMATYVNGTQIGAYGFTVYGGIFTSPAATDALDCCVQAANTLYSVGYAFATDPTTNVSDCLIPQFPSGCPANITSSYEAVVATATGNLSITVGNLGCGGTWELVTG